MSDREKQLEESLARCLQEALDWLDECRGCKPEDLMDYDGCADKAKALLEQDLIPLEDVNGNTVFVTKEEIMTALNAMKKPDPWPCPEPISFERRYGIKIEC